MLINKFCVKNAAMFQITDKKNHYYALLVLTIAS